MLGSLDAPSIKSSVKLNPARACQKRLGTPKSTNLDEPHFVYFVVTKCFPRDLAGTIAGDPSRPDAPLNPHGLMLKHRQRQDCSAT